MRHFFITPALFLLTVCAVAGDTLFPQKVSVLEQEFEKLGEYRYVYRLFFKLYEAALFTSPGSSAEDILNADTAFHLQFRYLRTIDKSIILKSADRMLEKNLSYEERLAIKERVQTINEAYTTVNEGDISSLTYIPGVGTTLMINNESIVTIEGKDFASLYFRIWLGDKAISYNLRDHLLGLR